MDPARYKLLLTTADAFNAVLRQHFIKDARVHPPTIVSAASRMAGTMLFRSFGLDVRRIPPGSAVLSEKADVEIPALAKLLHAILTQLGHRLDDARIAATTGTTAEAQLDLLAMQALLDEQFTAIVENSALTLQDASRAAAIGTGLIVHDCREGLGIERGIVIAMFGFVEGSKTAPRRLDGEPNGSAGRPWYKFW